MSEHRANEYRSLEVSAMAYEREALEARTEAQELVKRAERAETTAFALRQEMARIASLLVENPGVALND